MIRAMAFRNFSAHLSPGDAFDLEHACHCAAALNGAPYKRFVLKSLYALEQDSSLALKIKEEGAMFALSLADSSIFEVCSNRVAVAKVDAGRRECVLLLADLTAEGRNDLPEAGVKCSKCRSTDVSFEFSQTRSADEGTTVFCYCTKCSKRWKM
jgi:DNA-directed RNA polymerase subunit M/transcription elongation factor TFIIS